MSTRTIARSSSKRNSASALASSVLPTPVGPRKRKEPVGRSGSATPARARRTAPATAAARPPPRRVAPRRHGLGLADHAGLERLLHAQQLGGLALHHPAGRNPGPR